MMGKGLRRYVAIYGPTMSERCMHDFGTDAAPESARAGTPERELARRHVARGAVGRAGRRLGTTAGEV